MLKHMASKQQPLLHCILQLFRKETRIEVIISNGTLRKFLPSQFPKFNAQHKLPGKANVTSDSIACAYFLHSSVIFPAQAIPSYRMSSP